ncbi:MAG: lactonase family protein [Oscillospiraceae bacterium]|nr:lactonase family protein [Oscillospiraceae bacterium]
MIIFAGTYTKETNSKGIYVLQFDEKDQNLEIRNSVMTENPSFLAVDSTSLYAVNEMGSQAGYTRYLLRDDLSLEQQQVFRTTGAGSCHIILATDTKSMYIANYNSGDILAFKRGYDHEQTELIQVETYSGCGPNQHRQSVPHAHSVNISPNEKHLLVADLGTDKIMVYDILGEGQIKPNEINPEVYTRAGEGPRHLCFNQKADKVYLLTELLSNIITFSYDPDTGRLDREDSLSITPPGYSKPSLSAEVCLSGDGRFLYASNRGWDGIAIYAVAKDGKLSLSEYREGFALTPRSFTISKDDRYIVIGYQDSNLIVVAERNTDTGAIGDLVASIEIPSPVCVVEAYQE